MSIPSIVTIATVELLGGLFVLIGYGITLATLPNPLPLWVSLPGLAFGVLNVFAGVLLLRDRPLGIPASLIAQILQVVNVRWVSVLTFVAHAGLRGLVILSTTGVRLEVGAGGGFLALPTAPDGSLVNIGAQLEVGLGIQPAPLSESWLTISVNLFPIVFIASLIAARRIRQQVTPVRQAAV
jgi:hypothetical protein